MATKLPYVVQPNLMAKILEKIKEAKTPDRFTHDFLATKLKFSGGNYRQFIPLAKKLALLNSDGSPSDLYKKFRNSKSSKAAMAAALRKGYAEVFERNEYAGSLSKEDFKGLVVEITGLEQKDRIVQLTCQTFETLKPFANFEAKLTSINDDTDGKREEEKGGGVSEEREFDLGLNYTINLVLPKTDDPAVFNAIFRSLRDNLLRK